MGRSLRLFVAFVVFLLISIVSGCSKNEEEPQPEAEPSPPAKTEAAGKQAGPFAVTLTTHPPEPKAGKTHFQVVVEREGKAVSGAAVRLKLSMPSMQMAGPEVTLQPENGNYGGSADLSMAGQWEAKVTVEADGDSGSAAFQVEAKS